MGIWTWWLNCLPFNDCRRGWFLYCDIKKCCERLRIPSREMELGWGIYLQLEGWGCYSVCNYERKESGGGDLELNCRFNTFSLLFWQCVECRLCFGFSRRGVSNDLWMNERYNLTANDGLTATLYWLQYLPTQLCYGLSADETTKVSSKVSSKYLQTSRLPTEKSNGFGAWSAFFDCGFKSAEMVSLYRQWEDYTPSLWRITKLVADYSVRRSLRGLGVQIPLD